MLEAQGTQRPVRLFDGTLDRLEFNIRAFADSVGRRGLGATLMLAVRRIVHLARGHRLTRAFEHDTVAEIDKELGVRTANITHLSSLEIESPNAALGVDYQPSPPDEAARAIANLTIRYEDFTFIDVGCGRGLVLLLAARHASRRVIGVEFSPELTEAAQENIGRSDDPARVCDDVAAVCSDATNYELPPEPTVFYLFNPFRRPVLEAFVAQVGRSLAIHPRPLYLIYYGGQYHRTIRGSGLFESVDRTFAYTIYRHTPASVRLGDS